MICFIRMFFLFVLTFALGCSKKDPQPEMRDPIYNDLKNRAEDLGKARDEARKKIEGLLVSLAKVEPNSMDKKDIEKELANARAVASENEQMANYYRIRAERRRVEGRLAYGKAFKEQKEWPDPNEYSDYLVNRRLNEVNLNWNSRVPKLQERLLIDNKKSEKKSSESSGGGH